MNWTGSNALADFLSMGGYGLYVWGSFGMGALVIALEVAQVALRRRTLHARASAETDSRGSA